MSVLFKKELRFNRSWLHVSVNAVLAGSLLAYIIVFLVPFDTHEYQSTYKNMKLAGYALCFIFPVLIFHRLNLLFYKKRGDKWYIKDESISLGLMVMVILVCSYFYNIWIVNETYYNPSLSGFYSFSLYFGLPTMLLIMPLYVYMKHRLVIPKKRSGEKLREQYVKITGDISSDHLKLNSRHFYYAKAQGNYVEICYREQNGQSKTLIRSTLSDIHDQIPNAMQVHRSFLVNPEKIVRFEGNSRKRKVILEEVTDPIPVSHTYAENVMSSENSPSLS